MVTDSILAFLDYILTLKKPDPFNQAQIKGKYELHKKAVSPLTGDGRFSIRYFIF